VTTVVVVGGGLAGSLTAVHLLRRAAAPVRVTIVEARGDVGPGVAYGTIDDRHLLNVAAARMSALGEDPDHFLRWARTRLGEVAPSAFLPRRLYGDYLRETLAYAERDAAPGHELRRVAGRAVDIEATPRGARVVLAGGTVLVADHVVLAVGSPPAARPPELPGDPRVCCDPWSVEALAPAPPGTRTVIVGTGLTALDVALSATARQDGGTVVAVSRSGRLPHAHLPGLRPPAPPQRLPRHPASLAQLEAFVAGHVERTVATGRDWRDAVDGLRPHVPELWGLLGLEDRRRFLRERARDWEVCRHRMSPAVARRVAELRAAGRLEIRAGRLDRVDADGDRLRARLDGGGVLTADRLVLCTGFGTDVRADPLLARLIERGHAVADELGMGVRATSDGLLLDAGGAPQPWLATLGPARRGELWETTAAMEIRDQAERLAAVLGAGERSGGDGGELGVLVDRVA
jgi:uncharacterized NAD(P)/FAD-binding protein YdhS